MDPKHNHDKPKTNQETREHNKSNAGHQAQPGQREGHQTVAVVGGVAANSELRAALTYARFAPLVLATMHLSWGVGFLAGCAKHGPPVAAVAALAHRAGPRSRAA